MNRREHKTIDREEKTTRRRWKIRTRTVPPPLREVVRVPRRAEYRKVEDERDDLRAAVQRRSNDIAAKKKKHVTDAVQYKRIYFCPRTNAANAGRGCGGYALVLGEPARVACAHPPLGEDADRHGRVDGRVDADGEEGRVLQDDRGAELLEPGLRPEVPLRRP